MFTGIIKEIGSVKKFEKAGGIYRLAVASRDIYSGAVTGASVSVNGACLTLVDKKNGILYFDIMEETVRKTVLADLKTADSVNLEGSLRADSTLDGHFVAGHIDCVGRVAAIDRAGGEYVMRIVFPREFNRLVVEKGSVAIDGVSLTVGNAGSDSFSVYLIPHTRKITTLGTKKAGDKVNIEFDIIGKYIARLKNAGNGSGVTEEFLKEKGF